MSQAAESHLVDVLIRVLVADGLWARRTGPDRFEVGRRGIAAMEWCCVGDMLFGRAIEDMGERAWQHRVMSGVQVAPADIGRNIASAVRRVAPGIAQAS